MTGTSLYRKKNSSPGRIFGVTFALNSAVHSYLVLAYSEADRVSGVTASLWGAVVLAAIAGVVALFLPPVAATEVSWAVAMGDD